jgi:hypothetical protein
MTYDVFVATGTENKTDDPGLAILQVEANSEDDARAQMTLPVVMVVESK